MTTITLFNKFGHSGVKVHRADDEDTQTIKRLAKRMGAETFADIEGELDVVIENDANYENMEARLERMRDRIRTERKN